MLDVLVTGGAGFIGSNIVDRLVAARLSVAVIDDLSTGFREQVAHGVPLIECDIRSEEAADYILKNKPRTVIHTAAQMSVRKSVADPAFDASVNVLGLVNILRACQEAGTERFVFLSTGGAVYGEQDQFPCDESHPCRPTSAYGVSKRSGELYLEYFQRMFGISTIILRLSNVYGPRQNPHGEAGVIAIFSELLLNNRPPTIYGDGKQTRDFIYVGDVAEAAFSALQLKGCHTCNIGTGLETSVNQLLHTLQEALKVEVPAQYAEARLGEQNRSVINPNHAKKILGWNAKTSLVQGLKQTANWYRSKQ